MLVTTPKRLALILWMSLLPAITYAALASWYHWRVDSSLPRYEHCECGIAGAGPGDPAARQT